MPKRKKNNWGGSRPGAGRKPGPDGPRVSMTIQVPEPLKEAIRDEATANDESLSRAAERRLIRGAE